MVLVLWVDYLTDFQIVQIKSVVKIQFIESMLGRLQNRRLQESVSPPSQQVHWQDLSDVTLGTLECTESMQFAWENMNSKISALSTVAARSPVAGSLTCVPGAACSLWEPRRQ